MSSTPGRHIAIDARRLGDFGIGTYIRNLIRALTALDSVNRYTLIMPEGELSADFPPLAHVHQVVYRGAQQGMLHQLSFSRFLRLIRADLYHIPLNSVAYWMPQPYVVTIHDMSSLLYPAQGWRSTMHQEAYRRGAARAARIIAVSETTRRDVERVLRVDPSRVRTIYGAPDPAFEVPEESPEASQRVLDRYSIRPPYVLYAGSIRPQKNIPRLVEAFAVVRKELENRAEFERLQLVIIGDELSKSPAVRRAVAATRLEQSVRFLGFVPTETLRVFYRHAAVFAFPSQYEGFGLAPLEAMLCGAPVVTSDFPALVEAVGEAAELVSADNVFDIARGLQAVLENPARAEELKRAGLFRSSRFNWNHTASEVLEIYQELFT